MAYKSQFKTKIKIVRQFVSICAVLFSSQSFAACERELSSWNDADVFTRKRTYQNDNNYVYPSIAYKDFISKDIVYTNPPIRDRLKEWRNNQERLRAETEKYQKTYRQCLSGSSAEQCNEIKRIVKMHEFFLCAVSEGVNQISGNAIEPSGGGVPANSASSMPKAQQSNQLSQSDGNTPEQQMIQQAAAQARETQAKGDADAKRQGRRRHDPAMEATDCIKPNFGGLYGGMINNCPYKVNYSYCGFRPKENSWLTVMDCEKQKFGAGSVAPNREDATHTKGVESLHWFACKDPALPMEGSFDGGQIHGRCRVLFAN